MKRERLFGCYRVLKNALNQRKKLSISKTDIGDEKKKTNVSLFPSFEFDIFPLFLFYSPIVKTRNHSFREKSFRITYLHVTNINNQHRTYYFEWSNRSAIYWKHFAFVAKGFCPGRGLILNSPRLVRYCAAYLECLP